ncbi:MAG: DUF4293 domain-containing protein [Bacteroidota bacterium]
MIQRIQTIWLLLATAMGITSLKLPTYSGHRINDVIPPIVVSNITGSYNIMLMVATIATATLAFLAIFLFKNRKLQIKVVSTALVLSLITLFLYYWQSKAFIVAESNYTLTAILPISIPVWLILAIRGITKDEKLIKSLDRLR